MCVYLYICVTPSPSLDNQCWTVYVSETERFGKRYNKWQTGKKNFGQLVRLNPSRKCPERSETDRICMYLSKRAYSHQHALTHSGAHINKQVTISKLCLAGYRPARIPLKSSGIDIAYSHPFTSFLCERTHPLF